MDAMPLKISQGTSVIIRCYDLTMKLNTFLQKNLRNTLIWRILQFPKKSQNFSDGKIKCRENNMMRKLSDSHYVNN